MVKYKGQLSKAYKQMTYFESSIRHWYLDLDPHISGAIQPCGITACFALNENERKETVHSVTLVKCSNVFLQH